MDNSSIGLLVCVVAMVTSLVVFPVALVFAKKFRIVDNPNARKLQRVPVPVFGGVVVYAGILMGEMVLMAFLPSPVVAWGLLAMTIMMLIGTWDDMKDLTARLRFLIEVLLIIGFILITGVYVDNLHGVWGIHELNPMFGIPFSVILGAGIINAINMIDGVDGYSSGYCMLACSCFAIAFWSVWSTVMVCLALVVIGAVIPFFLHNVFGQKSRMFIGDGGTLMIGMLMVVLAFYAMSGNGRLMQMEEHDFSIVAFLFAVGSIPIFDMVRVSFMRMLRGNSPFKPDKTHLHHLFIDMGFSHLGAAIFILFINLFVVLIWLLSWMLGLSIDGQVYLVVALNLLVTFGFYKFMKFQQNNGPLDEDGYPQGTKLWHMMCKVGNWTHRENKRYWRTMRKLMDGPMLFDFLKLK